MKVAKFIASAVILAMLVMIPLALFSASPLAQDPLRDAVRAMPQKMEGVDILGYTVDYIGYIEVTQTSTTPQWITANTMAPTLSTVINQAFETDPDLRVVLVVWDSPGDKNDFVMSFDLFDLGLRDD